MPIIDTMKFECETIANKYDASLKQIEKIQKESDKYTPSYSNEMIKGINKEFDSAFESFKVKISELAAKYIDAVNAYPLETDLPAFTSLDGALKIISGNQGDKNVTAEDIMAIIEPFMNNYLILKEFETVFRKSRLYTDAEMQCLRKIHLSKAWQKHILPNEISMIVKKLSNKLTLDRSNAFVNDVTADIIRMTVKELDELSERNQEVFVTQF